MTISGSDPIHDLNQVLLGIRRGEGATKPSHTEAGQSDESPTDVVALSAEFKDREAFVQQIQALPDVRVELLESIREALDKGQYQIDGAHVASAMIKETVFNAVA